MRIWSLHPKYLDAKGLVALWRESLLAQEVLKGETRGYKNHPQLDRFKRQIDPVASIATYLVEIWIEAEKRGYNFDASKIDPRRARGSIQVTRGQLSYEWRLFKGKLAIRDLKKLAEIEHILEPEPHPLFKVTEGPPEHWERLKRV
jgi:hypothetical protein